MPRPAARAFRLLALAVVPALALPRVVAAQAGAKPTVIAAKDYSPASAVSKGERKLICRGATVEAGWILVADAKDPKSCGGENPAVLNTYNVWAVERIEGRPAGTVIDVCAGVPMPKGWALVDVYRDKTTCGHPDDPWATNVKRIRKG